jgi:hypothetical protein
VKIHTIPSGAPESALLERYPERNRWDQQGSPAGGNDSSKGDQKQKGF